MESIKNRRELARHFKDLGFRIGAEIGVFAGYYSEILCQEIPGLKLFAIDTWENYKRYRNHKNEMAEAYKTAQTKLVAYNCTLIKSYSMDAVKNFPDESLDFVYIDSNHLYSWVKQDIEEWTKKVRIGGIVAGHDYYVTPYNKITGVITAVDEYVKKTGYKLQVIDWDKENPNKDDRQPNWWFVKEDIEWLLQDMAISPRF
jgi:predicted O-methyltransferase YrrM